MGLVVGLVLGGMGLYLIGYPIIAGEEDEIIDYEERVISLEEDVELRKEAIFSELSEIEFDYEMNKLAEEDYKELKGRLQKLAMEVMKEE